MHITGVASGVDQTTTESRRPVPVRGPGVIREIVRGGACSFMVLGQPVTEIRRHQKRVITVTRNEAKAHDQNGLNRPGRHRLTRQPRLGAQLLAANVPTLQFHAQERYGEASGRRLAL